MNESILLDDFKNESNWDISYNNKKLKQLDSVQKTKLLMPFRNLPPSYSIAYFISKQYKIGDFQPIILRVLGTDYLTSWLLLIDKDCNPVSLFYLEGENCE
jgi:hypothetical protein